MNINSIISLGATFSIPAAIILTVVGITCIMFHKCYVQLVQYFVAFIGFGSFKRGLCVLLAAVCLVFIFGFYAGKLSQF